MGLRSFLSGYMKGAQHPMINEKRGGDMAAFFSSRKQKHGSSNAELLKLYTGWSYVCAGRNATAIADVPLRLYRTTEPGQRRLAKAIPVPVDRLAYLKASSTLQQLPHFKAAQDQSVEELVDHHILSVLRKPSPDLDGYQLKQLTQVFLEMTGDAYWYVPKNPSGMPQDVFSLPVDRVKIVLGKDCLVAHYELNKGNRNIVKLPPDDVVHFKFVNPLDIVNGYAPQQAVLHTSHWDNSMEEYENILNENEGRPSFVVTPKGDNRLDQKEQEALDHDFNRRIAGIKKAGRALVASGAVDITKIAFSPKEMAALGGRSYAMKKIANAFGVPLSLIETKDVNKANAETGLTVYARYTISPRLRMMEQKLNNDFVPMFDNPAAGVMVSDRIFLAFDNPVPEDREFELKERDSNLDHGVILINEVLAKEGKPPKDYGDVPLLSTSIAPLGSAVMPTNQSKPKHLKCFDVANNANAYPGGGNSYKVQSKHFDLTLTPDGEAIVDRCDCSCGEGHSKRHKAEGDDADLERTGGPVDSPDALEKQMAKVVRSMYNAQLKTVLETIPNIPDLDAEDWAKAYAPKVQPIYEKMVRLGGDEGLDETPEAAEAIEAQAAAEAAAKGITKASSVALDFWIKSPTVQLWIEDQSFKFLESATKTMQVAFETELAAGIANGDNVRELSKRMRDVFATDKRADRSLMVARTESARAKVGGKIAAWKQSGVVSRKVWIGSADACPFCLDAQAKWGPDSGGIPLEDPFMQKGQEQVVPFGENEDGTQHMIRLSQNYSDVQGPPLHPNCRGTLIAVVD